MAKKSKKAVLFVYVDNTTKKWLKKICAKEMGHVSQSTMVERILNHAKRNWEVQSKVDLTNLPQ